MINNKDEKPLLIQTDRGFSVLYRNKYLYSKYNPQAAITTQIASLQIPDSTLILCLSPVLGYGLKELAEKLPPSSYILALECDQVLMRFSLDHYDFSPFAQQRFSYIRTDSVAEVLKKIEALPLFPFKKCIALSFSGGVQLNQTFYDEVRLYADEVISRFWKNRITLMHLGRNYAHNTFRNLLSLARSLAKSSARPMRESLTRSPENSLAGSPAWGLPSTKSNFRLLTGDERIRKPLLIAGAGPSLDTVRDFIIKNRNSFFLLAVDAAAAALLPDIQPDAIVLVESQYWIDSAFIGLHKYGIPIFADLTASPRALQACGGNVYFFCTEYARLKYLERLYQTLHPLTLPPMGSVGLTAIQLALALTAPHLPILHTGLDFAWQNGLTHATGSSPAKKLFAEITRTESPYKLSVSTGMQRISGKRGLSYWTTPVLSGYTELYRHTFAGNERVIDIGTEGCFLNGRQADMTEAERILTDVGKSNINADSTAIGTGCSQTNAADSFFDSVCESDTANERYEALCGYLAGEAEALTVLNDHLQGKRSISEHMMEQLFAERDYLYSHFPDAARGYSLDLGFLKRAGIELRYLLKILG
ncbi:6-hydroxymethylpterin diphosphokinase MptE-like protein [Treponema sp. OMZ 305]|uniref:6-hydroxymethylpterin diphosphokinase MptE-like protein n=1 Tax=Treponema sp. OMZ 305 TaxID=1659192 RepID=UPI0020A25476|nr:6-hydroxymethylpterin diphosphokinase MptE-like protein [Treponema sp. OMZ 305]